MISRYSASGNALRTAPVKTALAAAVLDQETLPGAAHAQQSTSCSVRAAEGCIAPDAQAGDIARSAYGYAVCAGECRRQFLP